MSRRREPDQLPLFTDMPEAPHPPDVPPWRSIPADGWADRSPTAAELERYGPDLLRRDLQFLGALERHAGAVASSGIARFRERHEELVRHVARWLAGGDPAAESARLAIAAVRDLAELRLRILEDLEPDPRDRVLDAEPRLRVPDRDVERVLSTGEFELAEERGEVVEVGIGAPGPVDVSDAFGLIGVGMVDGFVRAYEGNMKAEQERRPLPARRGLGTFLGSLPVVWLDAVQEALGVGPEHGRKRKEREREIARRLLDPGTLQAIVTEGLSDEERRLLAYVVARGGTASAASVKRRFGSDGEDGWFWKEHPPTSPLGRLRLHGLVFVGAAAEGRPRRTVVVPRELVPGLEEALSVAGVAVDEGDEEEDAQASTLRPDLLEALQAAYRDGFVEPVWDDDEVDADLEELATELLRVPGGEVLYRRTPGGDEPWGHAAAATPDDEEEWDEDDDEELWDEDDDEELWDEMEQSYGLFFLSPPGEEFRFEIEGDFLDEDGERIPTRGFGRIGYVVAVSAVAPFALLRVTSLDTEEELGTSIPDIVPRFIDAAGRMQLEEPLFLETLDEGARARLGELRERIAGVLERAGVAVLGEDDLRQPVPWLEASGEVLVEDGEEATLTVEDALFFRHLG